MNDSSTQSVSLDCDFQISTIPAILTCLPSSGYSDAGTAHYSYSSIEEDWTDLQDLFGLFFHPIC